MLSRERNKLIPILLSLIWPDWCLNPQSTTLKMSMLTSTPSMCIPVNPPPLHGSLPCKSLISRMDWVSSAGDINLPHTPFPSARSPPNKFFFYFLQSPHLFTIDRLFPSIVEMFCINFYGVPLDFSFRNTKLIVVYVIEWITTPIRNVHSRRVLFRFRFK